MNVGLDNETGTVPLAELILKTEVDHDGPNKQANTATAKPCDGEKCEEAFTANL